MLTPNIAVNFCRIELFTTISQDTHRRGLEREKLFSAEIIESFPKCIFFLILYAKPVESFVFVSFLNDKLYFTVAKNLELVPSKMLNKLLEHIKKIKTLFAA